MRNFMSLALGALLTCTATARAADAPAQHVGSLTYQITGSGTTTLVLVPGLSSGAEVWNAVVADLAPRYRIVTVTLDGFDGMPAHGTPSLDADVASLVRLIDVAHLGTPVVVGHSLGGHLALRLAAEHPGSVSRTIVVDALPVFPPPQPGETPATRAQSAKAMGDAMLAVPDEQYARSARQTAAFLAGPESVDTVANMTLRSERPSVVARMEQMVTADLRPELANITTPVLVLAASPAAAADDGIRATYAASYAGTRNVVVQPIAGAHHFIMLDQRAAFERALEAFAPAR